jgi:hypothetical protein
MFSAENIHYEMSDKVQGIGVGGIGAFHLLATRIGLQKCVDEKLNFLKRHLPYQESDHVLNIAYNILLSGTCLGDIELLRNDENCVRALDAQRGVLCKLGLHGDCRFCMEHEVVVRAFDGGWASGTSPAVGGDGVPPIPQYLHQTPLPDRSRRSQNLRAKMRAGLSQQGQY